MKKEIKEILDRNIVKSDCSTYLFKMDGSVSFTEKNIFHLNIVPVIETTRRWLKVKEKVLGLKCKLKMYDEDITVDLTEKELILLLEKLKELNTDTSNKFFRLLEKYIYDKIEKFYN